MRMGYLLGGCVLAMVALTVVRQHRIAAARADLEALEDRAGNIKRQVEMIPPLERQMAGLLIKKRIDKELGSRADCIAALAELCRVMPPNLAMRSLTMKPVESFTSTGVLPRSISQIDLVRIAAAACFPSAGRNSAWRMRSLNGDFGSFLSVRL